MKEQIKPYCKLCNEEQEKKLDYSTYEIKIPIHYSEIKRKVSREIDICKDCINKLFENKIKGLQDLIRLK